MLAFALLLLLLQCGGDYRDGRPAPGVGAAGGAAACGAGAGVAVGAVGAAGIAGVVSLAAGCGVLPSGHLADVFLAGQLPQIDAVQVLGRMLVQSHPQIVGEAALAVLAILLAAAAGQIHALVHAVDDACDADGPGLQGQHIAAPPPAHAFDQLVVTQTAEQLLQVGPGDALAPGDIRQPDRPLLLVQGQVQHGGNGVTASGAELHGGLGVAGIGGVGGLGGLGGVGSCYGAARFRRNRARTLAYLIKLVKYFGGCQLIDLESAFQVVKRPGLHCRWRKAISPSPSYCPCRRSLFQRGWARVRPRNSVSGPRQVRSQCEHFNKDNHCGVEHHPAIR